MTRRTAEEIAAATHWRIAGGRAGCGAKAATKLTRKYREVDCPRCGQSTPYKRMVAHYAALSGEMADAHAREMGEAAEMAEAMAYESDDE